MTIKTFADRFRPHAAHRQDVSGAFSLFHPGGLGGASFELGSSAKQVEHYRLWSYIAILRNSMTASRDMPYVGEIVTSTSRLSRQVSGRASAIDARHQSFLRQFYRGVMQAHLGAGDDVELVSADHPLRRLFQEINDNDWWVSFAFETLMFWQLTGSFCWWVIDNGFGIPAELWVIPPQWLSAEYSKSGELLKWVVRAPGGRVVDLPPEEVIYSASKNPNDKTLPVSPVFAGAEWILNGEGVERVRQQLLSQGIWPSLLVHMGDEWDDPSEELIRAVGEKFMTRMGGPSRAGQPLIIPPHMQAAPWTLKQSELGLQADSDQLRDNTLALFGTPRAVAGIAHDLNRANIDGAHLIYAQHTIIPLQVWLAGVLTWKLAVPRFGESLRVWFPDCRPVDPDVALKESELDFKCGALTPNELRAMRGRSPLPDAHGDMTYISSTVSPLGESASEESASRLRYSYLLSLPRRYLRVSSEFRRLHRVFERAGLRSLKRFWRAIRRRVQLTLDSDSSPESVPSPSDLVPPGDFVRDFNDAMRPLWRGASEAGVALEGQAAGRKQRLRSVVQSDDGYPRIEVDMPDGVARKVGEFLKSREDGVWRHVLDTTHAALEKAISDGLRNGMSVNEIRNAIMDVIDVRAKEAVVIARTEATASLNFGQQSMRESEGVKRKVWISTVDNRTRPSHVEADEQVVSNNSAFEVGGYKMRFPGDASLGAPASEIISCRCCATGYYE